MPRRLHGFALAFSSLATVAGAFTQAPADGPTVMQAPLSRMPFFTVTRVDPDGTILLGPSSVVPAAQRARLGSAFAEGVYLLLTTDTQHRGKHRLLRVQVTDVADGPVFTLKTGARAATRVQVDNTATLVRPSPVTTARLRALPDEILIEGSPDDENAERDAREIPARRQSINNLRQIGLAMHNFHAAFNEFPPAVIFGPDGKPWHSWRVLLLPFLDHADLYNAYDFSQPWDSPKNKALIDKMPHVYRDPIYGSNESITHYATLVSPVGIFRPAGIKQKDAQKLELGKGAVSIINILDGTSNTIMVTSVEPGRKIPWTKPEDIDVGPAFKGFSQPGGIAAPYTFRGPGGGPAAPVLFADGSVHMVGAAINRIVLDALITCAGGEIIAAEGIPTESDSNTADAEIRTLMIRIHDRKVSAVIESATPLQPTPPAAKAFFKKGG